ncbi:peptidyl-prolyl cis-trans isomerase FKBP8-like isoform X1 [Hippocampus zosterae]|uniref:peptidyl-prolyl cis-trans isomerase FKBP8-like isoform X1 n=1 Tax=Hippocampus zosterae TaxID=109293 RepID=UPI00223C981B|nr:peptidyl-prolyl cis-trans isomerase FKBP8-like isoform X1 [Hippocampus zosterae]
MEPRPGCEEEPALTRAREPAPTAAPEGRGERSSRTEKDGGESPGGDGARDDFERPRVRGGEGARTPKKTVRFREASADEPLAERAGEETSLFPDCAPQEWSGVSFDELFQKEDWQRLTDERLLCKKVLEPAAPGAPRPVWGQQATVKMQAVLEDRTVVEKDRKLLFTIGEGDVSRALEEGVVSMRRGETALLLAHSRYAYGPAGREPDVPAGAPLLYQLQLLDVSDKADPLNLPLSDRIRAGNRKRERGNFHFQREEYGEAARAYRMALDVLTTCGGDAGEEDEREVRHYRVKCLNNLAAALLKLERRREALLASREALAIEPDNVKALYRAGKILSDAGDYGEAARLLKKALKLEPGARAIHAELSKLVKRRSGGEAARHGKAKAAEMSGDDVAPFSLPSKATWPISWKLMAGALLVALGGLLASLILPARN